MLVTPMVWQTMMYNLFIMSQPLDKHIVKTDPRRTQQPLNTSKNVAQYHRFTPCGPLADPLRAPGKHPAVWKGNPDDRKGNRRRWKSSTKRWLYEVKSIIKSGVTQRCWKQSSQTKTVSSAALLSMLSIPNPLLSATATFNSGCFLKSIIGSSPISLKVDSAEASTKPLVNRP